MSALHKTLAATALFLALPALAQTETEDPDAPQAVQERAYKMMHEIDLTGGLLPLDPFTKGVWVGGSYVAHFSDFFAWEIARGGYSFALNTDLRNQLERDFGQLPTAFDSAQFFAGSNVLLKPFYGKLSVADRWVIHAELFFMLGGTFFKYSAPTDFRVGPTLGVGARVFFNKTLSLRFNLDEHILISTRDLKVTNVMGLSLSLAINIGATE
jgi:outer membrane beta-barrel protein